jgi:hypothetical protein
MLQKSIISSFTIGLMTAVYFIPQIVQQLRTSPLLVTGCYLVQASHDAVCVLFFDLYLRSFGSDPRYLLCLNCLHGIIMMLFCYYKRCILTLLYNHMMGIDMCERYVPLWQRVVNLFMDASKEICPVESYRNTYMWLNNHILQSGLVFSANIFRWCSLRRH